MNTKAPVYIGDTINDVIAAKAAGMVSIYIGNENYGDITLTDISQLQEVLL
jgi:phosphoglycolate phosphatase-like HAD superfamily hydrolase